MTTLIREPSPAVRVLIASMVDATKNAPPQHVLDAAVNHLGFVLSAVANLDDLSRGELKRKARTVMEDVIEMALANYGTRPGD
jgi:hypothetical protein